nr:2,1-fructan:2,1-fructan 1-fructosyltransferase precursor [Tanacetum cinerariifolium]
MKTLSMVVDLGGLFLLRLGSRRRSGLGRRSGGFSVATFEVDQDALKATTEVNNGYGCTTSLGAVQKGSLGPFGIVVLADGSFSELTPVYFYIAKNTDGSLETHFCTDKLSESATGRDLAVLAATLHKQSTGALRVLDAMCGCGIRSLRYLGEAKADFVLANDANEECNGVIVSNLSSVCDESEGRWNRPYSAPAHCVKDTEGAGGLFVECGGEDGEVAARGAFAAKESIARVEFEGALGLDGGDGGNWAEIGWLVVRV